LFRRTIAVLHVEEGLAKTKTSASSVYLINVTTKMSPWLQSYQEHQQLHGKRSTMATHALGNRAAKPLKARRKAGHAVFDDMVRPFVEHHGHAAHLLSEPR